MYRKNARWIEGKIRCGKCNKLKEPDSFHKNKSRRDGYAGHCKLCASIYPARKRTGNGQRKIKRGKNAQKPLVNPEKRWLEARWSYFSKRALKKNLPFSFTLNELKELVKRECYYCDGYTDESCINGIDRVDNSKGYIQENCVSCCSVCNQMKFTHDKDFFLSHIRKIVKKKR